MIERSDSTNSQSSIIDIQPGSGFSGLGGVKRPFEGDDHCGDQFGHWQKGHLAILCIADGLGHGKHAEKAAKAALTYVAHHRAEPLSEMFSGCNRDIRDTRGVAMGIAVIDKKARTLTYAGIGNTRIMVLRSADSKETARKTLSLRNDFGIVGGGYKRLVPETVPFAPGDLVVIYTDGVKELIDLSGYDEGLRADAGKLAERIIADWGRVTDDAAVLVYRFD